MVKGLEEAYRPGPKLASVRSGLPINLLGRSTVMAVGRGVLLDVYTWAKQSYDPLAFHSITVSDLEECARQQNTTFEVGDILIVRSGWVDAYNKLDQAGKQKLADIQGAYDHTYVGLAQSEEMLDFLHDNYFAAAASDCICFEAWPPDKNGPMLHAYMLPLWGMPMGELWDLEKLAQTCRQEGRYTFLVTSAPENVPGRSSPLPILCFYVLIFVL